MVKKAPQLIVALDVPSLPEALELLAELDSVVEYFKVGKELFTAVGPEILQKLAPARVFLDLKFHDIPKTVAGAVASAARHGVAMVDVHPAGGKAMMTAAAAAAREAGGGAKGPVVLGVTVLTHLGDEDLEVLGFREKSREQVLRLAPPAPGSGLAGGRGPA